MRHCPKTDSPIIYRKLGEKRVNRRLRNSREKAEVLLSKMANEKGPAEATERARAGLLGARRWCATLMHPPQRRTALRSLTGPLQSRPGEPRREGEFARLPATYGYRGGAQGISHVQLGEVVGASIGPEFLRRHREPLA